MLIIFISLDIESLKGPLEMLAQILDGDISEWFTSNAWNVSLLGYEI